METLDIWYEAACAQYCLDYEPANFDEHNGNRIVSLAEIDKFVVERYPLLIQARSGWLKGLLRLCAAYRLAKLAAVLSFWRVRFVARRRRRRPSWLEHWL